MAGIQSSINSMIGSASHAVMAVRAYQTLKAKQAKQSAPTQNTPARVSVQQMAAQRAKQSVVDAVEAKKNQKRNFMDYLKEQQSSLGKIGDLEPELQNKIAKQYTPSIRKRLMDAADREAKNGKYR